MHLDKDTQAVIGVLKTEKRISTEHAIVWLVDFGMLAMAAEVASPEERRKILNRMSKTIRKDPNLKRAAKVLQQTWTV